MQESPAFKKMKEEGTRSKAPLSEAFGQWKNAKIVIIALLGLVAGQAVVWYTGQFYALFFLQSILKVDLFTANVLIAWSLILGTGGFIFFGSLSDRIGRKPIILGGCLIAALTYFPLFNALTNGRQPELAAGARDGEGRGRRRSRRPAARCSIRSASAPSRRPATSPAWRSPARRSPTSQVPAPAGTPAKVTVNGKEVAIDAAIPKSMAAFAAAAVEAGYPKAGDPSIVKVNGFFAVFANAARR